jgi:hypothetical protein
MYIKDLRDNSLYSAFGALVRYFQPLRAIPLNDTPDAGFPGLLVRRAFAFFVW